MSKENLVPIVGFVLVVGFGLAVSYRAETEEERSLRLSLAITVCSTLGLVALTLFFVLEGVFIAAVLFCGVAVAGVIQSLRRFREFAEFRARHRR